jgi:uncharacterized protein (TIGR02145 family)
MKRAILISLLTILYFQVFAQTSSTFKDERDGKIYKIVKIGTQTWMAENLAFKTSEGCWAYQNNEKYIEIYGYLYDFETAKKIAPKGWHLPNDKEWAILANYLGGKEVAGGKLKSKSGWESPNTNASNESRFNALPGGQHLNNNWFSDMGLAANFWSSTSCEGKKIWSWNLAWVTGILGRICTNPDQGFSVRLIKD